SWIAGRSSEGVSHENRAASLLHCPAAAANRPRRQLGLCVQPKQMWSAGRADLCAQMPLDPARIPVGLSDGGDAVGLPAGGSAWYVVGTAQPSRCATCQPRHGSSVVKLLPALVLLVAGSGSLAAQDQSKSVPPPPPLRGEAGATRTSRLTPKAHGMWRFAMRGEPR